MTGRADASEANIEVQGLHAAVIDDKSTGTGLCLDLDKVLVAERVGTVIIDSEWFGSCVDVADNLIEVFVREDW